jgi:hypothetical protein
MNRDEEAYEVLSDAFDEWFEASEYSEAEDEIYEAIFQAFIAGAKRVARDFDVMSEAQYLVAIESPSQNNSKEKT